MSTRATTIDPERQMLEEVEMAGQDRWEEIHRRAGAAASIRAIPRELDVDRKTVRRCLRQTDGRTAVSQDLVRGCDQAMRSLDAQATQPVVGDTILGEALRAFRHPQPSSLCAAPSVFPL